ncbi:SUMF1/EgtB/PvdO family nonheme iron enzyme [Myxococcota bacterium]|nr:SUMF1/EgtB/PvdO family nonheme iron enzyme [Myxococcota bacterium]
MTASPDNDFFISYPGHLEAEARDLRDRLRALGARAFVDKADQTPGTVMGTDIERVMKASAYTVAIFGPPPRGADAGYYNLAEYNKGIALEREVGNNHVVVPVQIGIVKEADVPLALQPKRRLTAATRNDLGVVTEALIRMLQPGTVTPSLRERKAAAEKEREGAIERGERKRKADLDKEILALDKALRDGEPLAVGQKLGRYVLKEYLGKGGFAEVWRAIDPVNGRVVALKVLHRAHHGDPERVRRFFLGATIMRELAEEMPDRIVRVWSEREEPDGRFVYVMEHIPGGDLEAALGAERIDREAAWRLVCAVGAALGVVHERGKVHRDVKPRNILIGERGPKLTDFDLVRDLEHTFGTKTQHGLGTLVYTAPEVKDDASKATAKADVYSLAMSLVFCLLGRDPTNEELEDKAELVGSLGVSEAIRAALLAGIGREARRPASVAALLAALESGAVRMETPVPRSSQPTGTTGPAPPPVTRTANLPRIEPGDPAPGTVVLTETPHRPALVHIPAGEFMMGSPEDEPGRYDNERPHRQRLTRPFLMAATPVTQAQYHEVTRANPSKFGGQSNGRHPVERVSWDDAIQYCNALSGREGRAAAWSKAGDLWVRVPNAEGYTLPTEAQWEWACRAGTRTAYWSGPAESDLAAVGWYGRNSGSKTHLVGEKNQPNPWGLHDMHGNVWEWTTDWFAPYPEVAPDDYAGPESGGRRVIRGGSWSNVARDVRAAFRARGTPGGRSGVLGFRVVLPAPRARA